MLEQRMLIEPDPVLHVLSVSDSSFLALPPAERTQSAVHGSGHPLYIEQGAAPLSPLPQPSATNSKPIPLPSPSPAAQKRRLGQDHAQDHATVPVVQSVVQATTNSLSTIPRFRIGGTLNNNANHTFRIVLAPVDPQAALSSQSATSNESDEAAAQRTLEARQRSLIERRFVTWVAKSESASTRKNRLLLLKLHHNKPDLSLPIIPLRAVLYQGEATDAGLGQYAQN
jgi:hypothetical protein